MFNGIDVIGSLLLTVRSGEKAVLSVTDELPAHSLASSGNVNRWLHLITSTRHSRARPATKADDLEDHEVLRVHQWASVPSRGSGSGPTGPPWGLGLPGEAWKAWFCASLFSDSFSDKSLFPEPPREEGEAENRKAFVSCLNLYPLWNTERSLADCHLLG